MQWVLTVSLVRFGLCSIWVGLLHSHGAMLEDQERSCQFPPFLAHLSLAAAAAKSLQSCPTLCNPIDSSPPGSSVPGILQARTLEWVAMSFSRAWKWKVKVKSLSRVWLLLLLLLNCFSRVQLYATPQTAVHQVPPSLGFSRQEHWSGLPFPSPMHESEKWKWSRPVVSNS